MRVDRSLLDYLRGYFVARDGNSTINGNLVPQEDLTYSLGSSSRRFDEIWVDRIMGDLDADTLGGRTEDEIARFFETDATDISNETNSIGAVGVDETNDAIYIGGLTKFIKFDAKDPTYETLTINPSAAITATGQESLQVNDLPSADWYNLVRFGTDRPIGFFTKDQYKNITFNAEYEDTTAAYLGGNSSGASDYAGLIAFYTDSSTFVLTASEDPHVEGVEIDTWKFIIYASGQDDAAGGVNPGITLWGPATDARSTIYLANQDDVSFPLRIDDDYPLYWFSNGSTSRGLVFNGVHDTAPNWLAGEGSTSAGAGMLIFKPETTPEIGLTINDGVAAAGNAIATTWKSVIAGDYNGKINIGGAWGATWADAIKINLDTYPLMLTEAGITDLRLSGSLGSSHISLQINQGTGSILRAGNDTPVYINSYAMGGGISANAYLSDTSTWYFGEQSASGIDYAGALQFESASQSWGVYVSTATGNEDAAVTFYTPFRIHSNKINVNSAIDIYGASSLGTPATGYGRFEMDTNGDPFFINDAGDKSLLDFDGAKVYRTNDLGSLSSGDAITFANEHWDTNNYHDVSTNTSRLTVPATGKYVVIGNAHVINSTNDRRYYGLQITVNGTTIAARQVIYGRLTDTKEDAQVSISIELSLSTNDYVELEVYADNAGSITVDATTDFQPSFSIRRIQ